MNTQNCLDQRCDCSEQQYVEQFKSYAKRLIAFFRRRNEIAAQMRQLREMEDHMLKDIGLSRADVSRITGRRRYWKNPRNPEEELDQRYRSSDHR
ncbi:MAG TPA: DUF1127 domain-containing protein [Geopsychrobacteraceae bacterium]|nr:DUF1127 domain-containing protein [Geopsychrobacteraceae bacterium]